MTTRSPTVFWTFTWALVGSLLGSAAAAGQSPQGTPLALDPGGFSVDLWKAGSACPPATVGGDLLANGGMEETDAKGLPKGWSTSQYVWLPVSDPAGQTRMLKRVKPLMEWASSTDNAQSGARTARLGCPLSAFEQGDPKGHEACAMFHQAVPLPQLDEQAKFLLAFHQRGWSDSRISNSRAYVRATFYDAAGRETRVYAQTIFQPSSRWRRGELAFVAPKTTRSLDVRIALTGCGEVWFDGASLHRLVLESKGPTARLMPGYFLDNLYCLSSGDPGVMILGFRNESGMRPAQPVLVLQLPERVEILDLDAAAKIVGRRPDHVEAARLLEYRIDLGAWRGRIRDGTFAYPYNMWEGLALVLRTSQAAGPQRLKARYWLEDGAYRSDAMSFDVQIVPPVPSVAGPQRFRSGAHLFLLERLKSEAATGALAALYRQVGFNSVHVPPSPLGEALRRRGIERYTQPLGNGYAMGDAAPGKKPADAVFRQEDGQAVWEAICPVEVYRRGPYFRTRIVDETLRPLLVTRRQAEQIMANWEPYMYNGRGCFCDRCKEEFRDYSKIAAAQLHRVWPKGVIREHGELWFKFRSWQHGRLMATLEETIHALGKEAGLDAHFIPEIHYGLLTAAWDKFAENREYAAVDYLDRLPVLEPWAPYNWYIFGRGPYDYVRGQHLNVHVTACEVLDFLDQRLGPAKRPRLIAFPYGTYEGATQPEALAFEFLTYWLNGYHGAFAYLFPGGYDARYWRAIAEANRQIAILDPWVSQGRLVKEHTLVCETPLPKPDPRFLDDVRERLGSPERYRDLPLLMSWEYRRGESRLVAVGNFWEQGECFFRVKLEGLNEHQSYVLHEPAFRRCYGDRSGRVALSATELRQGLLLHAGAMRHALFVIEPYRQGMDRGAVVRPQDMEAARQQRLPPIEKACRDGG